MRSSAAPARSSSTSRKAPTMVEQLGWHTSNDQIAPVIQSDLTLKTNLTTVTQRDLGYDFSAHFHPYVLQLMKRLQSRSIRGLQEADTDASLNAPLAPVYQPVSTFTDPADFPSKELDFDSDGAYAVYNWELFYHVPIAVAIHLSRNQRFFEAQQWFHYVFDPTDDSDGPTPQRFWRVKPLQSTDIELIERILTNLANPTDDKLRDRTIAAIDAWREAPFSPHRIARYRPTAYMFKAVMAYLDNLIDWGDSLFRQDTRESVYEALQIYVLAANILAQRPQRCRTSRRCVRKPMPPCAPTSPSWARRRLRWSPSCRWTSRPTRQRRTPRIAWPRCAASASRSISACPATTNSSGTGTLWRTGSSRFATA